MEYGAVMAWVWHPHEPQLGHPLLETVGKGVVFCHLFKWLNTRVQSWIIPQEIVCECVGMRQGRTGSPLRPPSEAPLR